MPALVAVRCERVLGYQRLEGRVEVDDWEEETVLEIRHCSVAAFVVAGDILLLKISVVADRWRIDDSGALALAPRYIAVGR